MVYEEIAASGRNHVSFALNSINHEDVSANYWAQIAEATMPLQQSKMASLNKDYTQLNGPRGGNGGRGGGGGGAHFQASLELGAKEISRKLIAINATSLVINLVLALVAFYFAFVNNSSATSAFAADCVLDFISSAIVLWRYCGDDLSSLYRDAREQIACIYLGALFEISALAIIVKASSDMASGVRPEELLESETANYDLVYLAAAATLTCSVLTVFKCALYKTIRDNSILLDVINTLISTVFAMSIIMSQALINVDPSFWYLDPVLSILLALFMAAFGLKVIHQNFNVLRPIHRSTSSSSLLRSFANDNDNNNNNNNIGLNKSSSFLHQHHHFGSNLNASIEYNRNQVAARMEPGVQNNWQKADYSTISFV